MWIPHTKDNAKGVLIDAEDACETRVLWRHTKQNVKAVLTDAERVKRTSWRHTKENAKVVLTDADMRVKRIHYDPIPSKTQKSS